MHPHHRLSPSWFAGLGLLLLITLWIDRVHWHGIASGLVHPGLVELRVHKTVHAWSWVGMIQPPFFSLLLHGLDGLERAIGLPSRLGVFLIGSAVDTLLLVGLSIGAGRRLGPAWGLLVGVLLAATPSSLRPFEHYPLAQLWATTGALAIVHASTTATRRAAVGASWLVLVGGLTHLATLFVTLPVALGSFVWRPSRRRPIALAGAAVGGLLLLATIPDFWIQIREQTVSALPTGGPNVGWSNPLLVGALGLWLVPGRSVAGRSVAIGVVAFVIVLWTLMATGLVNGIGFPAGMHYFTIVDPLLALLAVVVAARVSHGVVRAFLVAGLLASQLALYLRGVTALWGDVGVFLQALAPWRWIAGGGIP